MTDNRTNEQIVAEALCGRRYRPGTVGYLAKTDNPTDYRDARSVLAALRAAGRLVDEQKVRDPIARAALVAAAGAAPQAESEAGKRLSSEFRADLVEAARERIQAVWADVPEGVDAKTLAQNVVSAQEFFWLSLHFPVLPSSTVDEAALIREAKAEALEEKGYFLKGHAEWTRSNFLPGPHSDACAKYNDEIGDELIEDAAELRARAAEYRKAVEL